MRRIVPAGLPALSILSCAFASAQAPLPPAYDHVVIVVEENRPYSNIIGNPDAPYINSLATAGVNFTNVYGLLRPSQPNYLELFSGSFQGVTSNTTAAGVPFSTPNLGAALLTAGKTFTGYSDSLPSVGFTGDSFSTMAGQNQYVRKHNPWVNWQGGGTNQLPSTTNRPFTDFPANFSTLPTLSIVVPDEQHDMHDGTIAQGDTWLQNNIAAYANWAKANNSLLIVTYDEDDHSSNNHVPTIFYGANLRDGTTVNSTYTLHNLLRTVEDVYGTSHSGMGAKVQPVHGAFAGQASGTIVTLKQGANGYSSAHDTYVRGDAANVNSANGGTSPLIVDGNLDDANQSDAQALVRFDNLAVNVPAGATILSAKLILKTVNASANSMQLYRMRQVWSESDSWSTLINGIQPGTDAESNFEFLLDAPQTDSAAIFDVTDTLQAWLDGTTSNFGWAILPTGGDGFQFVSSEGTLADRPALEITYAVPEPGTALGLLLTLGLCGWTKRARPTVNAT